jgi:hypothetical protein
MKRHFLCGFAAALCLLPFAATAQPAAARGVPAEVQHYTFRQMTGQPTLSLRSTLGSAVIHFGTRGDELVSRAVLHLRYTYSPALIPDQSHLRVILNDETIGVIPLRREQAGENLSRDLVIDPRLLADFNRLRLEFVGHYNNECEDALHTSLWADVSGSSELELTVQRLALTNDLALLPEPFFDRRDARQVALPFVFASAPSQPVLNAAAVTASWFGQLAAWRGAHFSAQMNQLPKGHAIVFATNSERPAFLAGHAPVAGPTLEMITSPADGYSKLLLVMGRDAREVQQAARALVLGNGALSGPSALVRGVKDERPRDLYDAPNWVRTDRPTKFGELVNSPQDLQVFGHVPGPIKVDVRVPPDLFTWHSRGVPLDLKYRYPPPIRASESRLTTTINDELVQSFNLRPSGQGGEASRLRLPLLDDALFGENRELLLPAFKLGARNQLQFNFSFAYQKEGGNCRETLVDNIRAMVDADSSVDFSGFPHYAELPNLSYFANSGYPFTRYADLAETVVVLPAQPVAAEIETMLNLLGRLGETTGYPGTRVRVAWPTDEALLADADLLVIGAAPRQTLLERWKERLPADLTADSRRVAQPVRSATFLYDRLGFGTRPDPGVAAEARIETRGSLAAILGFESPLTEGRSVVAVTATAPEQLGQAVAALEKPELERQINGSAAFIQQEKVTSELVGETYTVGSLPLWTSIWYPLSSHPILLALLAVIAVLVFAFALWRSLRAIADRRMGGGGH